MNSSPLVHFEGDWPTDEKALIKEAVAEAEAAGLPTFSSELGVPWVAVRRVVGTTSLYIASRHEGASAMMDRAADGLADRIRRFAAQRGDSPSDPDPDPLFQLVYESEASRPMTEADLRGLLMGARSNNEDLGITGLLLYAQDRFLQVLEGPKEAVHELYDTIRDDPRHTNVETLHAASIRTRTFPDWRMSLKTEADLPDTDDMSSFLQSGDLPPAAEPVTEVIDALERFRRSVASA